MPAKIFIISDMEFDYCTEDCSLTNFEDTPVSYTHLDVYKRQDEGNDGQHRTESAGCKTICQQVRGLQGCQQAAHAGWCLHSEIRFAINCSSHGKNRIIFTKVED